MVEAFYQTENKHGTIRHNKTNIKTKQKKTTQYNRKHPSTQPFFQREKTKWKKESKTVEQWGFVPLVETEDGDATVR